MKEYAVYKDDEFLLIGTLEEIAKYLGLGYNTVRTYKSKKTHYIFIEVEYED